MASELPTAATTTTPCRTAYSTAAASTGEYSSLARCSGSRVPPSDRLITCAPWSTAQRIAAASASGETVSSEPAIFPMISCAGKAMPTIPLPSIAAAISPATKVPWPCSSVKGFPPMKLFAAAMRAFGNSGFVPSRPESTIATRTGLSAGRASPNQSNA